MPSEAANEWKPQHDLIDGFAELVRNAGRRRVEQHAADREQTEKIGVHFGEVSAGDSEIADNQRMLVGGSQFRGAAAVEIDNRVVRHWLCKDRHASRPKNAGNLATAFFEVEVVQDAVAENEVKAVIGERGGLSLHLEKMRVDGTGPRRSFACLGDCHVGNVDAGQGTALVGEVEAVKRSPRRAAAIIENISALRCAKDSAMGLLHPVAGCVIPLAEWFTRISLLRESFVVKGAFALVGIWGGHRARRARAPVGCNTSPNRKSGLVLPFAFALIGRRGFLSKIIVVAVAMI